MDRQYPEYSSHDFPRPKTYNTAMPSTPISSTYGSPTTLNRPQPAALKALYETQDKRPRGPRTRSRSTGQSTSHGDATCGNNLCDSPQIPADERSYPGPEGLDLCSRCYKRFKVERRRARESERAVTDDWRRPKRRRVRIAADETGARQETKGYGERLVKKDNGNRPYPKYSHRKEPVNKPSPVSTPVSDLERGVKHSDSQNVPRSTLKDRDRRIGRSPRMERSHRERDDHRAERNNHVRDMSTYEEAEFCKSGSAEGDDDYYNDRRCCCSLWSPRRKCIVILAAVVSIITLIIIIALAATLSRKKAFTYTPSFSQVNSTAAFDSGGATRKNVNDTDDGIGAGTDSYTYYQGDASKFPAASNWISFGDMWTANIDTFKNSCGWLNYGPNNSPEIIQDIYDAIQDRANASLVDHRIILATIIQETNGCPLNPPTKSSGGTRNPGLMQSHNGQEYDSKHSRLSILQMIQDGTQGTKHGWGLVDNLNTYGNPYKAMRGYNSGYIPQSGDLSEKSGATACYVSDMANRLTGWVRAESKCSES
ncbi:hypothetical protein P154DRAFT_522158 [Amniculicola lignicola CBS 123094]|uniref:Transglycosylase SLT domain-containing protein n=1 Tax=Amniculicola lignicola CBS 123094 TaxID=1392246 RepID=A0A6A5WGX0_9PLEO|nr:hypothetical protein P154DRAFT_522158 [Amniculicola lignicola CBS 123094]